MTPDGPNNSPLLTKWKDRFGRRHDLEISGPILEEDDFERRRRHLDGAAVTHVLVFRKFGNIGITATQLNLRPGDVVEVLEKYPVGYWRGKHNGREGIFDADCSVPCTPDGTPLEPLPLAEMEFREAVVEDAETSESHGAGEEDEVPKLPLRNVVLKKVSLRHQSASNANSGGERTPSPRPEDESQESVSVSIDPHLLDSIGESPRGVMAMIRSRGSRTAEEVSFRKIKRASGGAGIPANSANPPLSPTGSNPDTMVRLNIGGIKFATTLATICKYPDSMLAAMFGGRFAAPMMDAEGCYFIDRDGSHFRFILNFLRDGTVVLPDDPRQLKEILKEAIYFQLPQLVKDILRSGRRKGVCEFLTVRYLPGATYDGWPIRIEGTLLPVWIKELNGDGTIPPERESDAGVRNMFGRSPVWKMRGVFLTSIFNVLSQAGWKLSTSNGSGAGIEPKITFAELYVFSRQCNASSEVHTFSTLS